MSTTLRWFKQYSPAIGGALLLVAVGSVSVAYLEMQLRQNLLDSLRASQSSLEQGLLSWTRQQEHVATLWAQDPDIQAYAKQLLPLGDKQELIKHPAQAGLRKLLSPTARNFAYDGFSIIRPDGLNLCSSRDANIGRQSVVPAEVRAAAAARRAAVLSLPLKSDIPLPDAAGNMIAERPTMFSVAPIYDHGKLLAYFSFRINPATDFYRIFTAARHGHTGDTYAFDRHFNVVTPLRFENQLVELGLLAQGESSVLNLHVYDPGPNFIHTGIYPGTRTPTRIAATLAADRLHSDLKPYRDYRGVMVVGYGSWNSELNMGIVSEIDQREADRVIYLNRVIGAGSTILLLILFLLYSVTRNRENRKMEFAILERTIELEQERARYKSAEEQLHLLLDNAGEGICGLDLGGYCTFANSAALNMTGYASSELIGKPLHPLIHHSHEDGSPYPAESCRMFDAVRSGDAQMIKDEVLWRKDGSSFPVRYLSTPIWQNQHIIGAVVIFSDISAEKHTDRLKDEFVSIVSHELRTPLTAMLAALRMVNAGVMDQVPEKRQEMLSISEKNAQRLLTLINDLLDINKLEAGKVALNRAMVPLAAFLHECVEENGGYAEQYQTHFRVADCPGGDFKVYMDSDRMKQVMANLLSNAAKFSPPGREVEISAANDQENVHISVRDQGPGIPQEFQEHLFQKFSQADSSTTRKVGGTGLGLSIARELVLLHGGTLTFVTAADQGTTFTVTLPYRE